ncbi:DUF4350 domain-containing protein [Streptomyces albidoflavus]|uniref:DUF4350 domain-containing protein n=1 Tax=Streptomyces albidoflavus TaxID=1886 RepID=UPI0030C712BA
MLLIVVAGIILAVLQQRDENGGLDPSSYDPRGSRALAALLAHDGIRVQPVDTSPLSANRQARTPPCWSPPSTGSPASSRSALRSTAAEADARLVLVARGSSSLTGLAPGTEARPPAERSTVAPACAFPAAQRAGDADVAGLRCSTDASGAEPRHPSAGRPPCSASPPRRRPRKAHRRRPRPSFWAPRTSCTTTGSTNTATPPSRFNSSTPARACSGASPLFHRRVRRAGETPRLPRTGPRRLAMGQSATLFRRSPGRDLARPPPGPRCPRGPDRRRTGLGDDRGRARLYHRADARDQAAALLLRASRPRLAEVTVSRQRTPTPPKCSRRPSPPSWRATPPTQDPASPLFGPAPTDDAGLVRLADQLDALRREVRTS